MKNTKKIIAAALATALAASAAGCTPTIGGGTDKALNVGGVDINSGVYIYYALQAYDEASSLLADQNGETPSVKDVKNSHIDETDSADWIQNKAVDYCKALANMEKEFDALGLELSAEDKDAAQSMAEYYYSYDERNEKNGISLDTMIRVAESQYKEQAIFSYYYGIGSENGCTEEELKEYFEDNFARVKFLSISLVDDEGEKLSADEQRELRKMAENYAKDINSKSGTMNKMWALDEASDDYDAYLEAKNPSEEDADADSSIVDNPFDVSTPDDTTEEDAVGTETDAEEPAVTTTTVTDPYANERLVQKTTTTAADDSSTDSTETTAEETDSEKSSRLYNEHVFEMPFDTAEVYDYSDDTIYVIIRADLRDRMTEDDYWSQDYIDSLLSMRYYDEFVELMESKADELVIEKFKSAIRRYAPFKLELE